MHNSKGNIPFSSIYVLSCRVSWMRLKTATTFRRSCSLSGLVENTRRMHEICKKKKCLGHLPFSLFFKLSWVCFFDSLSHKRHQLRNGVGRNKVIFYSCSKRKQNNNTCLTFSTSVMVKATCLNTRGSSKLSRFVILSEQKRHYLTLISHTNCLNWLVRLSPSNSSSLILQL